MDKAQLRTVAEQLARPSGDLGTDISSKMNEITFPNGSIIIKATV